MLSDLDLLTIYGVQYEMYSFPQHTPWIRHPLLWLFARFSQSVIEQACLRSLISTIQINTFLVISFNFSYHCQV